MEERSAENIAGYSTITRHATIGGRTYEIVGPANYEQLLDDPRVVARFAQDEYMPYWAEFWPAAQTLAETVAAWPMVMPGAPPQTVLELGCGLGLVGLVAAARGYRTILSDYDNDSLAFVRENARRNGLNVETTLVDWRLQYPALRCARIIAAEVLYEPRNLAPIAAFLREHLLPGGQALICDAFRRTADEFLKVASQSGLRIDTRETSWTPPTGGKSIAARLFLIEHAT